MAKQGLRNGFFRGSNRVLGVKNAGEHSALGASLGALLIVGLGG
jgi:hypothetical protein